MQHRRTRLLVAALACAAVLGALLSAPAVARAADLTIPELASRFDEAHGLVAAQRAALDTTAAAAALADKVDALLPAGTVVGEGTRTITVDLSGVTTASRALRSAGTTVARRAAAAELGARILALRWAMGEVRPGPADPADPAALTAVTPALPSRTDTSADWLNEQIVKLADRIAKWLESLAPAGGAPASSPSRAIMFLVLAVPVVLVLVVLVRALRARRRRATAGALPPGDGRPGMPAVAAAADLPVDALGYAVGLAAAGAHREAVRALYGGAARHLVETGAVTRMRTRTNLEMLRDVTAAAPALAGSFATLTREFERVWYGHAEPGEPGFERARAVYERVVQGSDSGPGGPASGAAPQAGDPR